MVKYGAILLLCLAGCQPVEQVQVNRPIDPVAKPLSVNLGLVKVGSIHKVRFVITNTTDKSWTSTTVRSLCTCFVVDSYPPSLKPGQSGSVTATFTAPLVPVPYETGAVLVTNNSRQQKLRQKIRLTLECETVR
jgi:hypothetical protein